MRGYRRRGEIVPHHLNVLLAKPRDRRRDRRCPKDNRSLWIRPLPEEGSSFTRCGIRLCPTPLPDRRKINRGLFPDVLVGFGFDI